MKFSVIISVVIVVCVAFLGFVLFFNPSTEQASEAIQIEDEPVALGFESQSIYKITIISQGQGTIEVAPYKSLYEYAESVSLKALAFSGWEFDHWEGDIPPQYLTQESITIQIPDKDITAIAVFTQK